MIVIKIIKKVFRVSRRLLKSRRFRAIMLFLIQRKLKQQENADSDASLDTSKVNAALDFLEKRKKARGQKNQL